MEKEAGLVVKKGNKDVKKYKEKYKEGRGEEGRNNQGRNQLRKRCTAELHLFLEVLTNKTY